ncbi:zinc finger protein 90-like [Anoplophora glabripennis]|uniref:zinc finger protein 90-like n=1 Tax=Anoplophora glabripennis TaxID=217634 RepID=UPI0008752B8C|nr:zinc finger protein 90-like [Anoplophora glabripennis]
MDTEDILFPYIGCNKMLVNLKEIYLKEKGDNHFIDVSENQKICRLCFQLIKCGFVKPDEVDVDIIDKYIPQVNISAIKDPVICELCFDSLATHGSFVKKCLDVQEKYENNSKQSRINIENVDLNLEEDDQVSDPPPHGSKRKTAKKSKRKRGCKGVRRTNNKRKRYATYGCDKCSFKTHSKYNLTSHQIIHKDLSELQMFKCDECSFETKYKGNIKIHKLQHNTDPSKIKIYKCDKCTHETKYKCHLKVHQLRHKQLWEIQMYKCDNCDFQTKRKEHLQNHQLLHKKLDKFSGLKGTYKCKKCTYETNHKHNFIRHELKHVERFLAQMYKCDKCDFETKYKLSLIRHQLTHKNFSELQVFECKICDFKTKHKDSLRSHQIAHKKGEMYKCYSCDFETACKRNLINHQVIHRDTSLVRMHTCDVCDFVTKHRSCFSRHKLRHKSEIFRDPCSERRICNSLYILNNCKYYIPIELC